MRKYANINVKPTFIDPDGTNQKIIVREKDPVKDYLEERFNNTLNEYSDDTITVISRGSFVDCVSLKSINTPRVKTIEGYAFRGCTGLTSADFPDATSIGESAFASCANLSSVNLPKCSSIDLLAFQLCAGLTSMVLPECTSIGIMAFSGCTSLTELYLLSPSVCILSSIMDFMSTPIASGLGSIFVPMSLVDSYKSDPNWAALSNVIFGIE